MTLVPGTKFNRYEIRSQLVASKKRVLQARYHN